MYFFQESPGASCLRVVSIALVLSLTATAAMADLSTKKSIGNWVNCGGGNADDTSGAIEAFAAARHGAFTLVVDCPVHLHSGMAIDRGIFIDTGTTVKFTGSGKFFVDNMFHPAFIIADSHDITLTDWNVEWDGIFPVNPNVGGYELDGKFVSAPGTKQPAGAFNDLILTKWLADNRSVTFDEAHGWVKSVWVGGVNPAAVFFMTGDSYYVAVTGMKLYVPPNVGANHFMPMAFSFSANWRGQQTVHGATPHTKKYVEVPHRLTFSGVKLDGTLMGFQGNAWDALFEDITSLRYGDSQDSMGGHVGGIGKWFPPPHLFYLNYAYTGDPGLFNTNIHIENVSDMGPRLGVARDKGGSDGISGYALSLKLGCTECSVNNYTSNRPDGFMDVLPSDGMTVSNVNATFDSQFINYVFPAGLRFPGSGYSNVTFENVQMKDTAELSLGGPIGNAASATNEALVFSNVQIELNRWAGSDLPLPTIGGLTNNVALNYTMTGQSMKVTHLQKGAVTSTLKATPTAFRAGGSTVLHWSSRDARTCTASGAWSGPIRTSGSVVVKLATTGNHDFTLRCSNGSASSSTTLRVVAH